jgi:acyl-CoA reductase-like NAD-dependent aldehyde dehydrogenase
MDTEAPRSYGHHIAGVESAPTGEVIERRCPGTGDHVATFARGTRDDAERAIAAARTAFDEGPWPRMSGQDRARVLLRLAELMRRDAEGLARIEAEEVGKPIRLARGDVQSSIGLVEYAAALAMTMHGEVHSHLGEDFTGLVVREPCGVIGMITPWNFPLLQLVQKLPFALGAGCTAVCKPSELTSGTTVEMARLVVEAGAPQGVFNVVTGQGSVVGQALAESAQVDFLSFTGSTAVGRRVVEASQGNLKRVSLELGGKGATIVFPDADLDEAVDAAVFANVFNSGECCVSGTRLLVHEDIADRFVAAVSDRVQHVRVGSPLDDDTDVGAMIHAEHLDKVLAMVARAEEEGGKVLAGGGRPASVPDGYYVSPTVVDEVAEGTSLFREEVFGPVLAVTRFHDAEEAVRLANAVDYGLANSVWSKNIDVAFSVARQLRSGTVWINTTIDGAPQLPGGGVKASGYGREMGQAGFDEFTELKTVQIRTGRREPFVRVPDASR